jgi:hypothetical protein
MSKRLSMKASSSRHSLRHSLRRPLRHFSRLWPALGLLSALALGGCGVFQPPQPWEKGKLAQDVMKMDKDPLEARFMSHVYFSKEASSGGDGVGGGGCGCN